MVDSRFLQRGKISAPKCHDSDVETRIRKTETNILLVRIGN